jgi:hypothetical protein
MVKIQLEYDESSDIMLPTELELLLDLKDFKGTPSMAGMFSSKSKKDKSDTIDGKVIITYSNYIINQEIDDSIFK